MIRTVGEPSGIEVGFWGTIQKFAVAGARHQGTAAHRAQVQDSYTDYKRWLAQELGGARWFSRAELLASPEDDSFRLPRRDSIARRLIEDWLAAG